jgi:hypothetical protein
MKLWGSALMFAKRLPPAPGYLILDFAQLCPGERVVRGAGRVRVRPVDAGELMGEDESTAAVAAPDGIQAGGAELRRRRA